MKKSPYLALLGAVCLTGTALAQGGFGPPGPGDGRGSGRFVEFKMGQLVQQLGLDQETAKKLLPLLQSNRQERQALTDRMQKAVEALANEAKTDNADQAKVAAAIDNLEKMRGEFNELRNKHHAALRELLGTVKYGRYLAFEEGWKGQMKARLDQRRGPGRGPGRGPNRPATANPGTAPAATPAGGTK